MTSVKEHELARLRAMTPFEKLRVADGLWCDARRLTEAAVARRHPDWTTAAIQTETRRIMSSGRA